MEENKIIYFYASESCAFCIKFKKLIKILECEHLFKEINMFNLKIDKKIILTENTQIYYPLFFYYENGDKILINNEILFQKLTNNLDQEKLAKI